MIGFMPTTQTQEGFPYGDCVRASYAALFGVPIEAIPRFDPASLKTGETQHDKERRWLRSLGLDLMDVRPDEAGDTVLGEHLISGLSPRGFGHRCVGVNGRVVWDPHPSRAGLVEVWSIGLIVPVEDL